MPNTFEPQRARVVVTSTRGRTTLPAAAASELEAVADVRYVATEKDLSRREAMVLFAKAEVVAFTPKVAPPMDEAVLAALPELRGIALYATGYDLLDLELLDRHGVTLTYLPDYSTTSVAEHTLGILLALSRRIHLANDRSRGRVPADTSLRGFELAGRTLGIVGFGRIGRAVGRLGRAVGMRVLAFDPQSGHADTEHVSFVSYGDVLRRADAVALLRPAGHGPEPTLGLAEIEQMRPGAVLVNTSRARLVDTDAVAAAIRAGHLRGYAVDDAVFDPHKHADLLAEGRVLQTGHSAWWSDEVLERGGAMWVDHIRRLVLGHPIDVVRPAPTRNGTGTVQLSQAAAS